MQELFNTNLITTINTMIIPGIYWIGLESVLKNKESFSKLRLISLVFILIGVVLFLFSYENIELLVVAVSFVFPFYHLWLYKTSRNYFIKKEDREPIDTAFNWSSGLEKDRFFSLFFVLFSIFSSFIVIGVITWVGHNIP